MAGYSTIIESRLEVSGIDEIKRASSAIKELNGAAKALGSNKFSEMGAGFAKAESGAKKATDAYKVLTDAAKTAGEASKQGASAGTYSKQVSEINKVTEAYKKQEAAAKQAVEAQKASFAKAQTYAQQAQKQSQEQAKQHATNVSLGAGGPTYSATGKKIGSGIKEATAAVSVGMIGAQVVMGLAEKIKESFAEGYEYTKEQSGMQGTWKTLVAGSVDEGISKKQAGSSKQIVGNINKQSISYGRSLDLTDEAYQQMYHATESSGKTKHMVQSELRIADAMNLSDDQASHLITFGIGHALDRGRVNAAQLNQMSMYAPAITGALSRAYIATTTGKKMDDISVKEVDEEKKQIRDQMKGGEISAEMLSKAVNYLGDTKFKNAAENAMSTLPGMTRAVENGIPRMMSAFENSFAKPLEKTMGEKFLGLSKWFTSGKSNKAANQLGTNLGFITSDIAKAAGIIAPYAKSFADGTWQGLSDGLKFIKGAFKTAQNIVTEVGKVTGLNKSNGGFKTLLSEAGKFIGMATALGLTMKTLRGGANLLVDGAKGLTSLFSLKNKAKPDTVFASATNRFSAAVNEFAAKTGVGGTGAGMTGVGGGTKSPKFATRAERMAYESGGIFSRSAAKGRSLVGGTDEEISKATTRAERAALTAAPGFFAKSTGKLLTKFGETGMKISATKFGSVLSGISKGGKFFGRGMPLINGAFAAVDVANAMSSTQKNTQKRHKEVGGAIGGGVGAIAGGAALSFLGPLGIMGGSIAGGWAGTKLGEIFGGMTGGKSDATVKKEQQAKADKNAAKVANAQNYAENVLAKESFADQMKAYGYDKKNANELYSQIQKGTSSKSKKKQVSAAHMEQALENGDVAGMLKYQAELNKQNGIKPGQENANNRPKPKPKTKPKPVVGPKPPKASKKSADANSPFAAIRAKANTKSKPKAKKKTIGPEPPKTKKPIIGPKKPKATGAGKDTGSKISKSTKKAASDTKKATNEINKLRKAEAKAKAKANNVKPSSAKKLSKTIKQSASSSKDKMIGPKLSKSAKKATSDVNKLTKANKNVKGPKADGMAKFANATKKSTKKASDDVTKASKKIGKTKLVPKSSAKDFNKLNKDAKSGVNKTAKTVKKGAKDVQKSAKDIFKFKTSKSPFNKLNSQAKSGMNKVTKTIKSGSKKVQQSGKNIFKFKSSKAGFNQLNSTAKSGMNKVTRTVKSGSKKVQNSGKDIFKFKSSKSGFNQLNSTAKSGMNRVNSTVKSGAKKVQNTVKTSMQFKTAASGFNQLNSKARSGMNKVDSTIKSASNKWTATIKSGLSKAATTMTSLFNKMASTASSASSKISTSLGKVGTAASNAASKVSSLQTAIAGLKSKTITLTVNVAGKGAKKAGFATGTPGAKAVFASLPRYAKGTTNGGHTGGMALVNDAKGSNWREAFMLPNGLTGIFPNKRNIVMPLPAGTQVLNGDDTKKMFPHYAKGTDGSKKAFSGGKTDRAINITVNINGSASASDANTIANTIGEKLMTIMRPQVI